MLLPIQKIRRSCCVCAVVNLSVALAVIIIYHILTTPPAMKPLKPRYWGKGRKKADDTAIRPFKIHIPETELKVIEERLRNTRDLTPTLEGVDFQYGINTSYFSAFLDFWKTKYNWTERVVFFNKFPHFKTQISGLNIHFIHVRPEPHSIQGREIRPILLLHGWPYTFADFFEMIPLLVSPQKDADFLLEVVIPTIPGFGFSEPPSKPGLHHAHIALIMDQLMARLGHDKYYVHGGDWGSVIGQVQAILLPDKVLGYHGTLCTAFTAKSIIYFLLSYLFPSIFVEEERREFHSRQISFILKEGGYFYIQSTQPDTIGVAMSDSPAGLAAYLLEKFALGTHGKWKTTPDGGIENLRTEAILDSIMMYWLNNAVTPSMRIYAEFLSFNYHKHRIHENIVTVPSACLWFKNQIFYFPRVVLEKSFSDLVSMTILPRGGHFTPLEEPRLLAEDIWNFLKTLNGRKK